MTGRTHLLIGGTAALPAAWLAGDTALPLIGVSALAALGPDLDHPQALASRLLWPLFLLAPGFSEGPYRHGRRWLYIFKVYHRNQIHSCFGAAVAGGLLGGLAIWLVPHYALAVAVGAVIGWLSHLAADMVNVTPMELGWPFTSRKFHPLPFAVRESSLLGRLVELLVWVIVLASAIALTGSEGGLLHTARGLLGHSLGS